MDGRMKTSRDLSPDLSKVAMQPKQKQTRKVQVVYYLSRGGQLEHPHFMEVALPYNQVMRLRDVMDRLTILRGKGMPSMFSWSCKRSYKNGYVWNDLAEDDVICPADGVEYVLKGSELFEGCSERYQEFKTSSGRHASEGATVVVCSQERTMSNSKAIVPMHSRLMTEDAQDRGHPRLHSKVQYAQNVSAPHSRVITREDGTGIIRSETPQDLPRAEEKSPKPCLREYKVFKSEPVYSTVGHGADAATQTSEDNRTCTRGVSTHQQEVEVEEEEEAEEQSKERECTQNPTELSAGDQSPPSSSTSSSSEAHHNISSRSNDEAAQLKPASIKSVRFEEPNVSQSSRFSLLQLISCGSLVVEDNNVLMLPHKPGRVAHTPGASSQGQPSPSPKKTNQSPNNNDDDYNKAVVNRTLAEEFDTLRFANAQIAEKEYFSGSIVELKAKAEEDTDPTLNRSASFNAERGSKSEMGGAAAVKEGNHHSSDGGTKTKCIPRLKSSRKELKNSDAPRTSSDLMSDRNSKGSWSNRFP